MYYSEGQSVEIPSELPFLSIDQHPVCFLPGPSIIDNEKKTTENQNLIANE
jgi:hypothetical protein